MNISRRFRYFLLYKCDSTKNVFIGPEWARLAINIVFLSNNIPTMLPQEGRMDTNTKGE